MSGPHPRVLTEAEHGRLFRRHLRQASGFAVLVVAVSLGGGMLGYMTLEHLPWRDAFLNTAMLLGGMGPVDAPRTNEGKVFEGFFALYAGIVFLVVAATLWTPVVHKILRRFHAEQRREEG